MKILLENSIKISATSDWEQGYQQNYEKHVSAPFWGLSSYDGPLSLHLVTSECGTEKLCARHDRGKGKLFGQELYDMWTQQITI